jgi:hypothetical protein
MHVIIEPFTFIFLFYNIIILLCHHSKNRYRNRWLDYRSNHRNITSHQPISKCLCLPSCLCGRILRSMHHQALHII